MDTDVLIVGAGPTGLMLANQLAQRGIRALIIDRHAGPSLRTRALGVQARTLEIYVKLGIVDRALALGRRATGANLWAGGRRPAGCEAAFETLRRRSHSQNPDPEIITIDDPTLPSKRTKSTLSGTTGFREGQLLFPMRTSVLFLSVEVVLHLLEDELSGEAQP